MKARLWYWLSDNGDGSASLRLCNSEAQAEAEEAQCIEDCGNNFAEDTVNNIELEINGESMRVRQGRWNEESGDEEDVVLEVVE